MKQLLRPWLLLYLFMALLVAVSCNSVYNDYPALSMHYYVNGEYHERNEDLANPSVFFATYYEAPLFINNDNNEISDHLRFTMRACMADIRIIADTLVFLEGVKYYYGNWDKTRYTAEGKEIPHRKLIDKSLFPLRVFLWHIVFGLQTETPYLTPVNTILLYRKHHTFVS